MAGPAPAPSDGGTPSKRRRTGDGGESRPASAGAGAGARAALAPKSATKKGDPDAVPDAPAPLGAYMQREAFLAAAEAAGDLSFEYVRNDGDPVNSMWLIGLKQARRGVGERVGGRAARSARRHPFLPSSSLPPLPQVFSRQLPNMPKELNDTTKLLQIWPLRF